MSRPRRSIGGGACVVRGNERRPFGVGAVSQKRAIMKCAITTALFRVLHTARARIIGGQRTCARHTHTAAGRSRTHQRRTLSETRRRYAVVAYNHRTRNHRHSYARRRIDWRRRLSLVGFDRATVHTELYTPAAVHTERVRRAAYDAWTR